MESYGEIEEVKGVQLRAVELLYVTLRLPTMRKKKKDTSEDDYDRFRAEVTRLRKEIRQDKMQAEVLVTMIDVAKGVFNIPVRIKAVTK